MKTLGLPALCFVLLGVAGCSVFVQADRSKVKDDMYVPTDSRVPDAGELPDAGDADDGGSADAAVSDAGDADGG